MKLPKQLTTVTPLSKYLALSLFIIVPMVTFALGFNVGKMSMQSNSFQSGQKQSSLATTASPTPKILATNPCNAATAKSFWTTFIGLYYTFKYSSCEWKISGGTQPAGYYIYLNCNTTCESAFYIGFTIEQLVYKSLDEYKATESYTSFSETQNVIIDDEPAIRGIEPGIHGDNCCSRLIYFVVHKGKGYQITYEVSKLNLSKFSQFPAPVPDLSTFQFTD